MCVDWRATHSRHVRPPLPGSAEWGAGGKLQARQIPSRCCSMRIDITEPQSDRAPQTRRLS